MSIVVTAMAIIIIYYNNNNIHCSCICHGDLVRHIPNYSRSQFSYFQSLINFLYTLGIILLFNFLVCQQQVYYPIVILCLVKDHRLILILFSRFEFNFVNCLFALIAATYNRGSVQILLGFPVLGLEKFIRILIIYTLLRCVNQEFGRTLPFWPYVGLHNLLELKIPLRTL